MQKYCINFTWELKARILLILLCLSINFIFVSKVHARPFVTVKVTVQQAGWNGCGDHPFGGPPEVYFKVKIDDVSFSTRKRYSESNISPFPIDEEFSVDIDFSRGTIPIKLEQWDKDGGFLQGGDDDICDIKPGSGNGLNLNLNLATCQISGDLRGNCDTTISSGQGVFDFKIEVVEQPRAPNLSLRCLHDPIWPQPGDSVTITAQVLDGNGNPITRQPVDNIEIWADKTNTAIATSATTLGSRGTNFFVVTHAPANGSNEILYRCRARDNGEFVSTGWRRVQIGQPVRGRAVGILNTGVQGNRVDIVFIADKDDYPLGVNDPKFLTDVSSVINNAYYAGSNVFQEAGLLFLQEQDMINFWIALDPGNARGYVNNKCGITPPNNWNNAYTFAENGAILHTTSFRDCAIPGQRIFSSMSTGIGIFLHETGHSPFGLADEYCCDGGYFQADIFPNVYDTQTACLNDSLSFGVTDACQRISGNACLSGPNTNLSCIPNAISQHVRRCGAATPMCGSVRLNKFRLDPLSTFSDDLMTFNRTPRSADVRRINWFFSTCRDPGGEC